jgi:hypothetical protein
MDGAILQVATAISIAILSVVALLFVALCRMRNLGWLKFSAKLLPVPTFTFEVSADSKLEKLPPGENEPKDLPRLDRSA